MIGGRDFRLADEVRYIQRQAAHQHGRIDGPAFVYADNDSGRVTTVLGYPTDQLAQIG